MKKIAILNTLADNMRRLRKIKHLTQEELAYRCGLHPYFIGLIERKTKTPSLQSLEKLANALNISPAELITGYNTNENKLKNARENEIIQTMKNLSSDKADALLMILKLIVEKFAHIKPFPISKVTKKGNILVARKNLQRKKK